MSKSTLFCPTCNCNAIVKNGKTRHGKQNYKCNDCGRQFVENPKWRKISEETKQLIDRLLLEKIPLAGISRVLSISERSAYAQIVVCERKALWSAKLTLVLRTARLAKRMLCALQSYVNQKYESVSRQVKIQAKKKGN